MLDEQKVDAVYLSLPPFAHGEIEFDIIERGLPFFVEKPVALQLSLANEIAAAVREKNLMTCVGYQLRYAGSVDAARAVLQGATIGLVSGFYWCGSGRAMVGRWWEWKEQSGGQLVEQATHTIDMMRYLGGEIEEVFSYQDQRILGKDITDCPDVTTILLRFANGAAGAFTCTSALHASDFYANFVDLTFNDSRLRWTYESTTITTGPEVREAAGKAIFNSVDDAFVQALKTGDRSVIRSDYDEALRTLAVTLAANKSAQSGQPVRIDEFIKSA
jgi:predicted dehydrogenase